MDTTRDENFVASMADEQLRLWIASRGHGWERDCITNEIKFNAQDYPENEGLMTVLRKEQTRRGRQSLL